MPKKKLLVRKDFPPAPTFKGDARKVKQGWDLYEHGISYSLLSKFIVCRERFRLRVVEGLKHRGSNDAMDFGTVFHKAVELSAQGKSRTAIQRHFNNLQRKESRKKHKTYDPIRCKLVSMMVDHYKAYWTDVLKEIQYFESEQVFQVPFKTSTGHIVPINGKRDEGYIKDKKIWLQENKTKTQINETQIVETLPFMLQPMIYLTSFQHDHPGKKIGGILYNIVRNPSITHKKKQSVAAYIEEVSKDIDNRPEHYFKMFEVDIDDEHLEMWKKLHLDPILSSLCIWWDSIKSNPFDPWVLEDGTPNPHHTIRPFGVYDPLSRGVGDFFGRIVHGTDVGLDIDHNLFPELEED